MLSKPLRLVLFLTLALSAACSSVRTYPETAKAADVFSVSDADPEIKAALDYINKAPESTLGYQQLAITYIKRARLTGDFSLNRKAETAVKKALEISPSDLNVQKLNASLQLTFHRFDEALALATEMQKTNLTDSFVYGVMTDANVELGNYDAAVASAQKMVDLRPNSASYARVAHLRAMTGDHNGAVEMFKLATRTADPSDKEAQSWCLAQLGDELWKYGKYAESEKVYDEALTVLPDYYLAEIGKGRVRASLGDLESAIAILTKTSERIPNVDAYILLGDIYTKQGNTEKARQSYDLVEIVEAKLGVNNDQKRLALMWANNNTRLDDAFAITTHEHDLRKDINTADALAWVQYRKGNFAEAKVAITEALRLKSNDARIQYHAGMIEKVLGDAAAAKQLLESALKLNPNFDLIQSGAAQNALVELKAKR